MKKVIVLIILVILALGMEAAAVSPEEALRVAWNWVQLQRDSFGDSVILGEWQPLELDGITVFHLFRLLPKGYIMVSADDNFPPVRLYCLNNDFGAEGKAIEEWLLRETDLIAALIRSGRIDPQRCFAPENRENFRLLARTDFSALRAGDRFRRMAEVQPMVSTHWY